MARKVLHDYPDAAHAGCRLPQGFHVKNRILGLLAVGLLAGPMTANAVPVYVTDQQNITTTGQLLNFSFASLPTLGTSGTFSITLNGDYSGFWTESAVVTIAHSEGYLRLSYGMYYSVVPGLSLVSVSPTEYNLYHDNQVSIVFSMTDTLLNNIISTGTISLAVQNEYDVDPHNLVNPDFVRVSFAYESVSVPEPGTLALLGLGLAGLGFSRRRKTA